MNKKAALAISIFSLAAIALHSLEFTEVSGAVSDVFESLVDENTGLTTFRSLNIPSGSRIESLGTAGTALCDDVGFFDYNPAASSVLASSEIAVYHNAWIADSALETIAAAGRNANFGYGGQIKCFYVPFTEYNLFGDRVAGSYYSETSLTGNVSYNFKPGYYFKGVAVGANAKVAWRNVPDYTSSKDDSIIEGSGLAQSGLAFMVDAGILLRFNVAKNFANRDPNFKIGFALNNFGVGITGFGKSIELDDPVPSRVSLGLSYRVKNPILITVDFKKPLNLQNIAKSELFSAGAGVEVSVTKFCNIDAGFLLSNGTPRISLGSTFKVKKIELGINYTLDVNSSLNPVNHISCSLKALLPGKAKIRGDIQKRIDDNYIEGLRLYALGDYEEAILHWDMALEAAKEKEMSVTFEPALEAKVAARRFLESKQKVTDMNTFAGTTSTTKK